MYSCMAKHVSAKKFDSCQLEYFNLVKLPQGTFLLHTFCDVLGGQRTILLRMVYYFVIDTGIVGKIWVLLTGVKPKTSWLLVQMPSSELQETSGFVHIFVCKDFFHTVSRRVFSCTKLETLIESNHTPTREIILAKTKFRFHLAIQH